MACTIQSEQINTTTFLGVLAKLVSPEQWAGLCEAHAPVPRRAPKLSAAEVVTALVYHQLQPAGSLARPPLATGSTREPPTVTCRRVPSWP